MSAHAAPTKRLTLGDLAARRSAGACVVPGVGGTELDLRHARDRAGRTTRSPPPADICGHPLPLWTLIPSTAAVIMGSLPARTARRRVSPVTTP